MKSKFYLLSLLLSVTLIFTLSAFQTNSENDDKIDNKNIIKFSHMLHAEQMDCADCHTGAAESTALSDRLLPDKPTCAECHDVEDEDNCELCHYEENYEALVQSESQLIFSHKYHLDDKEMSCEECHAGFAEIDYSSELKNPNPAMANCYTCHNDISVASNACESCHISTVGLIPETHKKVNFVDRHGFSADEESCQMCHASSFCEDCHVATNAFDNPNRLNDFYTPYSPHNYIDDTKQQVISRVHELNYRYTHGIDAKGKSFECTTCHETETFCAECHSSDGGDFAMGGIVPLSHTAPDFLMGSGGEHAVLAKRDIERCASCHDTQGADPNCIQCHQDFDGIEGTNPKTHQKGFMMDTDGSWHDDDGAVCYNCHINTFTTGVGFCGYCHGAN
ncbi:MAG: cytochrome c3 family protein [Ignavibacteriae bacterium]|nr:cytochrome C [Ignavibacteriota bacterium]NOG97981.1 cytochrome c3 family protein [Ignavibacteriota bacterium]